MAGCGGNFKTKEGVSINLLEDISEAKGTASWQDLEYLMCKHYEKCGGRRADESAADACDAFPKEVEKVKGDVVKGKGVCWDAFNKINLSCQFKKDSCDILSRKKQRACHEDKILEACPLGNTPDSRNYTKFTELVDNYYAVVKRSCTGDDVKDLFQERKQGARVLAIVKLDLLSREDGAIQLGRCMPSTLRELTKCIEDNACAPDALRDECGLRFDANAYSNMIVPVDSCYSMLSVPLGSEEK